MKEGKAYIGDEIVEGNKLIADFMGWVYFGHNDPRLMIDETIYVAGWKRKATNHQYGKGIFKQYLCRNHSQLAYHSSWDWLMPVVEKIEKECFKVLISTFGLSDWHYTEIRKGTKHCGYGKSEKKIESTWIAVVDFIKNYNQNKQS